jgi:chromosome segregation ATPase
MAQQDLQKQVTGLNEDLENAKTAQEACSSRAMSLELKLIESDKCLQDLKLQHKALQSDLDSKCEELNTARTRTEELNLEISALRGETDVMKAQGSELTQTQDKLKQVSNDLDAMRQRVSEIQRENNALSQQCSEKTSRCEELEKSVNSLVAEVMDVKNRLRDREMQVSVARDRHEHDEERVRAAEELAEKLRLECVRMHGALCEEADTVIGGIGLVVRVEDGKTVKVKSLMEEGAAMRSGMVQAGMCVCVCG